jgi:CRP-like cAMP-binding protein
MPDATKEDMIMPTDTIAQALMETEFFRGFSEQYFPALAKLCREVSFGSRTTIFEEFDKAGDVFFIQEGKISLAICDASGCRQIAVLGEGELLSWSPLIGRTRLFDTAKAHTRVRALAFKGEDLVRFCEEHPEFGFRFMQRVAWVLAERLLGTRRQLLEVSGVHLPEFAVESD